jgi:uncharacterized membrane protein
MVKEDLAIGSILSIPISLIIDWLLLYSSIPDYNTLFTTLNYLTSFNTTASPAVMGITFSNAMVGLAYFIVIYAIIDAFTTIIISLLKNIQNAVNGF